MEKYENLGLVGEGSYGIVMKCRHKATGALVAIKKFLESEDDKIVRRIANREIKMLKQLRHENLVNLIDLFKRKKKLFLVFEFVDYTLLDDLEKNPSGLEYNYSKRILFQVLRAIEFCHNKDVIHRDIKPENILVSKSGIVKLCDFGFARPLSGQSISFTDYVATRWYRAPELLVGDTKYGKPVDIWAIGCLASEMFAGDPLFPGDSDIDQLFHIVKCIGSICQKHIEIFKKNVLFKGLQIPESNSRYSLENRYPKMVKDVLYFIKKCLDPTPELRPTCTQLMSLDLFPDKFSESLINEIKIKVQKEREKNPLLKALNPQSPNISKSENAGGDSTSNKVFNSKPPIQIKTNTPIPKILSNLNYKSKWHENSQIVTNNNNNNNVIFKSEFSLNNQENEISSDNKNFVYVDEEAWEDVRPLTSRKERVASRAGRYPAVNEESLNKEDNLNESPEHIVPDIQYKCDADEIQRKTTIIYKDSYPKPGMNMTSSTMNNYKYDNTQSKLSSSPRNLETPLSEPFNKISKSIQGAFIQIKPTENSKIIEKSPSIETNMNQSSPTSVDTTQAHSLSFSITSKKPIPIINNNSLNGNSPLTSKVPLNSYSPFNNYAVKQNINNFPQRNFGFPSEGIAHSYLPNIGKDSKFRQNNSHFHNLPSNKSFIPSNNSNVFKASNSMTNEKTGYYYNSPNKRRPLVSTRPNPINYQEHNISLPELKGAEMPILRTQIFNTNPKHKYQNHKSNFLQNESSSNTNYTDNFTNREP